MSAIKHSHLIIPGSDPASYSAAVYAACANLKPLLITGLQVGGQLTTPEVDNGHGDIEGLTVPALMERIQKNAERFDTEIVYDNTRTAKLQQRPLILDDNNDVYGCDALIITISHKPNTDLCEGNATPRESAECSPPALRPTPPTATPAIWRRWTPRSAWTITTAYSHWLVGTPATKSSSNNCKTALPSSAQAQMPC